MHATTMVFGWGLFSLIDFISCWLAEDDPLPGAPEVRNMACESRDQPRLGSRAWARS